MTTPTASQELSPSQRESSAVSLTQRTARGTAWTTGATIAAKVFGFVGQIFLARLLTPNEWGTVSLALTTAAFTGIITRGGIRESLISRQSHFGEWRNAAFWLSAILAVSGSLLTAVAGPVAARVYGAPSLSGMMVILAIGTVFDGLSAVPEASLISDLRFRLIALTSVAVYVGQVVLSIALAKLGFGALSMIIPLPLVSIGRCLTYSAWAPPRPRWKFEREYIKAVATDSTVVTTTRFFDTVQGYTDYTVMGLFHSKDQVGSYFFAYNLSVQLISVFAANLSSVLFPVWSQLRDQPERQLGSFVRAMQVLVALSVPFCMIQAAIATPMLHFFFTSRWDGAIVPLQILSIGSAFRIAGGPATNLLQSQGRFKTVLWLSIVTGCGLVLSLSIAAYFGAGRAVAVTESICFFLSHLVQLALVARGKRRWWRIAWDIYAIPVILSSVAALTSFALLLRLPSSWGGDGVRMVAIAALVTTIYCGLLWLVRPQLWKELLLTAQHVLAKRQRTPA